MLESVGDSLPSIISTTIAMIVLSGLTLIIYNKTGAGAIAQAASRESDRLIMTQAKRIELLEVKVSELEKLLAESMQREKEYIERIDALEKLVSDDQIRKVLHGGV